MSHHRLKYFFSYIKQHYLKLFASLGLIFFSTASYAATYSLAQGATSGSLNLAWSGVSSEIRIEEYINRSFVRIYKAKEKNGSLDIVRSLGRHTFKFSSCYKTWYFKTKCSSSVKSITLTTPVTFTATINSIYGSVDLNWTAFRSGFVLYKLEVSKNNGS